MPAPKERSPISRFAPIAFIAAILAMPAALAPADSPEVAKILEPAMGGAPLNPGDIHMEAKFEDGDGDGHLCSDWEIKAESDEPAWKADCATGVEKVHIHLGDGEFMNSHAGRTMLKQDTEYVLRVRFRDDSGAEDEWSEWKERSFSTVPKGEQGSELKTWTPREGYDVEVFAKDLQLPVGIAMVPDPGPHNGDPFMYVTELYGKLKVVTRDGTVRDYYPDNLLNFNPTGNFPGSGEMGLTGVAVDPDTGDVFASLMYEGAGDPPPHYPKVIKFESDERGLSAAGPPTVVLDMNGETQGAAHQVSNLEITPDGNLIVHNGDGGHPNTARDLDSFRGKILRMDLDGNPLPDNPHYDESDGIGAADYVYASGFRNPFGGALRLSDDSYFLIDNGPKIDRVAKLEPGHDYLWAGNDDTMDEGALYTWNPSHGPVSVEVVEEERFGGSGFPAKEMGNVFVTESDGTWTSGPQPLGKRVVGFEIDSEGELGEGPTTLAEYSGTGKATAIGLAAGPDGLYFSDLYKDADFSSPIDRGANVLRIRHCGDRCPGDEPVIRHFGLSRKVFAVPRGSRRAGRRARSAAVRYGTAFRYALSERAIVRIGIKSFVRGWRVGRSRCRLFSKRARQRLRGKRALRRCVLPAARGVRVRRGCRPMSWRRVRRKAARCVVRGPRGGLKAAGRRGGNRRPYAGRLRGRWLRPGVYLAVVAARDAAGNKAKHRFASFRVVRGGARLRAPRGHSR